MLLNQTASKRPVAASLLFVASLLTGCEEPTTLIPVGGRVTIDGEPLTVGTIRFIPESGRPVSSTILEDGSFQLAVSSVGRTSADGVPPGTYRIAVSASRILDEQEESVEWIAPAKYSDFRTSGLESEITQPIDDLHIELTWEGSEAQQATEDEGGEQPEDGKKEAIDQSVASPVKQTEGGAEATPQPPTGGASSVPPPTSGEDE